MKRSKLIHRRPLRVQPLEQRLLLAGDWHNQSNSQDVNGDGRVSPMDALQIINVIQEYSAGEVTQLQQAAEDAGVDLAGGFHPDVNRDGSVLPSDVLQVINRLSIGNSQSSADTAVLLHVDDQGAPERVVFRAADGRNHEVTVGQENVNVVWSGQDVTITNSNGEPLVIAKPGVGILEGDFSGDEGLATVYRFDSEKTVVETYLCVPALVDDSFIVSDVDIRQPIEGFERALGAIVEREIRYLDETVVTYRFEEASLRTLVLVTATLPSGETGIVEVFGQPAVAEEVERDLLFLLHHGQPPAEPLSLAELASALATLQIGL